MLEPEELRADSRERRIPATPPDLVYAAFSDPDRLAKWWGPEGFSSTFEEFDLRPGGHWRFTMHGPDGRDYWNESVFLEVLPARRVVIEHGAGHHFVLTISYTQDGPDTIVGWRQVFDTAAHYRKIARFVARANEQNLDRMSALLSHGASIA